MKKLLEPTLPDLATTSTTISSQNLQKMKMLTDGLPSNIYAALCCFKPVDSNLECLLPHFNHNSSKCLTFDYKQDENDINLLCQEIERHLSMSHHFFISSFATKEWIGNGTNYISFKQMVKPKKLFQQLFTFFIYLVTRNAGVLFQVKTTLPSTSSTKKTVCS